MHTPNPEPTAAAGQTHQDTAHLTEEDTYLVLLDACHHLPEWGTLVSEQVTGTPTNPHDPITHWTATIREDSPDATPVRIGHADIVAAMRRIITDTDTIRSADIIVDTVRAALTAPTNDLATDELCELDAFGSNVIVQVAVLGHANHS